MRNKNFLRLVAFIILGLAFFLPTRPTYAQRLPDNLIAAGQSETTLAGIDIVHSHLADLIKKFGKPQHYKQYPQTEDTAEATWITKNGVSIHVNINSDNVAFAVDAIGADGAQTGAGLALGQTVADVKRIYGGHFQKQGNVITVQWSDETELRITLKNGRIAAMALIASEA